MESFFRNLRTLLLALVLALAVWVSAVTAADPDEVKEYPQPVTLQVVGQDPGLVVVGTLPEQVKIILRAPRSAWNQLATGNNQVRAILDLSGLQAGDYQLRIQPQVSVRPVRVVSVDPQVLDVKLEPLASVTLPINLAVSGEPAVGFEAGTARLDVTKAVISGPQSQISQIVRAEADLNIAGLRQDVQTVLPVQVLDANGNSVPGLTISPKNIQVSLPVTQQGGYRDIAVKVNVRGQQAGGYRVTNISVFPPVITVFSKNPAVVNDLPGFVETEPLNLNGESQDLDLHLKLNLPTGISIVGDQTVQVQVGIAPIEGSLSLNGIPVEIIGLAAGLQAQISPALVDVILTGPLPLLDKLTTGDIRFVIDLTGLDTGTHQAVPQAQILIPNIRVQSVNPGTIEIIIGPGGTLAVTPTPTVTLTGTPAP